MSKRFGRNQRRRARETITTLSTRTENLERAHEMDRELLRYQSDHLGQLRDELEMAKKLACNMSILFPAVEHMEVGSKSTDNARLSIQKPFELSESLAGFGAKNYLETLPLETLIASIERDRLNDNLHVKVTFGDGIFSYGITRPAWHCMTIEKRQKFIQRELPRILAQQIALHNFK